MRPLRPNVFPQTAREPRARARVAPTAADRELVEAAARRLLEDPLDCDALFTTAAWSEVTGDLPGSIALLNRLISQRPDYPGVWWVRARVLKELGRDEDALASERIARVYVDGNWPASVRTFRL